MLQYRQTAWHPGQRVPQFLLPVGKGCLQTGLAWQLAPHPAWGQTAAHQDDGHLGPETPPVFTLLASDYPVEKQKKQEGEGHGWRLRICPLRQEQEP